MNFYKKLIRLLDTTEQKQALFLLAAILVMAVLDVIGASSIMPFMAVAVSPKIIETSVILKFFYDFIGVGSEQEFLWVLGVLTFILLVTSLVFRAVVSYLQIQFVLSCEFNLGKRLIESYLSQSYIWFLGRHTGELAKGLLSDVSTVVNGVMMPVLVIVAQGVSIIAILLMLLFVDLQLTLVMGLVSLAIGFLLFKSTKKYLTSIGADHQRANEERFTAINEVFGAVKEVKFGRLEGIYIEKFLSPARRYAKYQALSQIVAQLPRYILEGVAFGGMMLVLLILMQKNSLSIALPTFALYAFAGYRIMPGIQQIYGCFSMIHFNAPKLNSLSQEINQERAHALSDDECERVELNRRLEVCNVWFAYPNTPAPALKDLNLNIAAGTTVAFVGSTGSGKTTTADVILGLLSPSKGELRVDGKVLNSRHHIAWRRNIGYVPQQIFLSDQNIASNIAFGVEPSSIDWERVECAARIAHIHDFILKELPSGYSSQVGERGVLLSGGQRQRIGIARALYHMPRLLILDEATSALDNLTERAVLNSIKVWGGDKITSIMIAHRLSTVKNCDQIYLLDRGSIKDVGRYDELIERSAYFRAMVNSLET